MKKIAIITGGSNGIGRAAALELGKRGINVILTYNNYKDRADAAVKEIEKHGVRAAALKLDLTKTERNLEPFNFRLPYQQRRSGRSDATHGDDRRILRYDSKNELQGSRVPNKISRSSYGGWRFHR